MCARGLQVRLLIWDMAPKAKDVKLASIIPTEEELSEVREKINCMSEKEKRSKVGSLTHFFKVTGDLEGQQTRGLERKKMLETFMVWQCRQKNAQKTSVVQEKIKSANDTIKDFHMWSAEQMDKELGAMRGQALRASGKLESRPCSITGSKEEHMLEFKVPIHWERFLEGNEQEWSVSGTTECDESIAAMMSDIVNDSSGSGSNQGEIVVKQEIVQEKTSEELLCKRISEFKATKKDLLRRFQDMQTSAKVVHKVSSESDQKYALPLTNDLLKHVTKLTKLVRILAKAVVESPEEAGMPKLFSLMDDITQDHQMLQSWAEKVGFVAKSESKRRRTKKE